LKKQEKNTKTYDQFNRGRRGKSPTGPGDDRVNRPDYKNIFYSDIRCRYIYGIFIYITDEGKMCVPCPRVLTALLCRD
jgi:hypothetical protein